MATKKIYKIGFDMKYSHDRIVSASNTSEAKRKAFEKFIRSLKISDFNIDVEKE